MNIITNFKNEYFFIYLTTTKIILFLWENTIPFLKLLNIKGNTYKFYVIFIYFLSFKFLDFASLKKFLLREKWLVIS